jgi:hypothetical protein
MEYLLVCICKSWKLAAVFYYKEILNLLEVDAISCSAVVNPRLNSSVQDDRLMRDSDHTWARAIKVLGSSETMVGNGIVISQLRIA